MITVRESKGTAKTTNAFLATDADNAILIPSKDVLGLREGATRRERHITTLILLHAKTFLEACHASSSRHAYRNRRVGEPFCYTVNLSSAN